MIGSTEQDTDYCCRNTPERCTWYEISARSSTGTKGAAQTLRPSIPSCYFRCSDERRGILCALLVGHTLNRKIRRSLCIYIQGLHTHASDREIYLPIVASIVCFIKTSFMSLIPQICIDQPSYFSRAHSLLIASSALYRT